MLRDNIHNQLPHDLSLNLKKGYETVAILSFIDDNISGFKNFYNTQYNPQKENRISDLLVHYLQYCKSRYKDGFTPYDIRKNPTQVDSGKETDIGIFLLSLDAKPVLPIFEFEAKRLSQSSNNKEYVVGLRGGIERFKKGEHAPHLSTCGMFGYVQNNTAEQWIEKINKWIDELSQSKEDTAMDWSSSSEKLSDKQILPNVVKLKSQNYRSSSKDTISIWHYMIELT